MSVKGKRTIWAGPADKADSKPLLVEGTAANQFLPGNLVVKSNNSLQISAKAATEFDSQALIAVEYGDHIDGDVDTPYTAGQHALAINVRSGEFVNALVAATSVLVEGVTALSSNGAGALKVAATDGTEQILFYTDESLTVGASAELVRVRKA